MHQFKSQTLYTSDLFWNDTWYSAQWRALCTEIIEVNLSAFIYRLFHEDFSSIYGTQSTGPID